jgi:hypothetical protein
MNLGKHILSGKWDARSRVYNLRKDLSAAVGLADALGAKVPLGRVVRDFLNAAIRQGMTDTDYSRLYERFNEIVRGPAMATRRVEPAPVSTMHRRRHAPSIRHSQVPDKNGV